MVSLPDILDRSHADTLHNITQICFSTPGLNFQYSWNEQVLNLTGKDNIKSEPGAKDVGSYLLPGRKKKPNNSNPPKQQKEGQETTLGTEDAIINLR